MSHIPSYMTGDCCSGYPECIHRPPITQSERATEQIKSDLQILKDFILSFTARDVDKEWKAFRRIRTELLGD